MDHQENSNPRQVPASRVPGGASQPARSNSQPKPTVTQAQMPQAPVRRVRRPARASSSQKTAIVCLALGFVFLLGALFGSAVCRFVWEGPLPKQEDDALIPVLTDSPSTQVQPDENPEPVPTTESATAPVTQPTAEVTTAPATESTAEPHSTPQQDPPPEPQPAPDPIPEPEPEPTTEPAAEPEDSPAAESEFVIPDSNTRYLTAEDYESLSDWELTIALNELYARHGYEFKTPEIQAHFDSCSWYEGTLGPDGFRADMFNDIELSNSRLLRAALDAR